MKVRFLSLITPAPTGFLDGTLGKRELLSGAVVLLTPSCEFAYGLLENFRTRVEGILLTIGDPAITQLGPLLWHLSLPQSQINRDDEMLALALDILATASNYRNRAEQNEQRANTLADDLDACRHDYSSMRSSLYEQVIRLSASENKLSAILNSADIAICLNDSDGKFLFANKFACHFMGTTPEQLPSLRVDHILDAQTLSRLSANTRRVWEHGEITHSEEAFTHPIHGEVGVINLRRFPLRHEDGRIYAVCSIAIDITERKQNEKRQRLAASVFASSYEGIVITDEDNRIVDTNPAFTRITGHAHDEAIGQPALQLLCSSKEQQQLCESIRLELNTRAFWRREVQNRRKNGEEFTEMLSVTAVTDTDGKPSNYIFIFSDISQIKQQESEIHRISYHDTLTGLPNRRLLLERMNTAIMEARRSGQFIAVCCLDLDGFKSVNDRYSPQKGDSILISMATQIKKVMRIDDQLARLGGDEFSLLITNLDRPDDCSKALERILQAVRKPIAIGEDEITITGSLGATIYPTDGADAETLMRHADQAMYLAKKSGGNCYHIFDAEHERESQKSRDYAARLRLALQQNEFELYYQPKVDLTCGCIAGAEALIRWKHPENGILPPSAFLRYITGNLVEAIGEWVIESALTQMGLWLEAGMKIPVSINIDAGHISQANFSERLACILARHDSLPPETPLEMEILETAALSDTKHVVSTMERCHQLGVRFSLDDFGTGYSSLTYLRSLPVDILKIDQSFVHDMLEDKDDMGIVESIVRLGSAFNCQVIAEGMETMEHGAALLRLGCKLAQGYGIARPMPASQMADWVRHWRAEASWKQITSKNPDCSQS